MGVNIYKTDFGLFSIIVDDVLYNTIKSSSDVKAEYFKDMYFTVAINSDTYNADTYILATNICPNIRLNRLSNVTESDVEYLYMLSDTASAANTYRYYQSPSDLRMKSAFRIGTKRVSAVNSYCPYGVFTVSGAGSTRPSNYLFIQALLTNNSLDNFKVIGFNIIDKNISYKFEDSTASKDSIYSSIFKDLKPIVIQSDPYEKGGNTDTGGGTGTFDGTSTPVSIPNLPTLSAVDTGFITLFNPSLSEMKNLANYMWSDLFDLDGWKKIFADPMDAILGLSLVPVAVPDGGQKTVTVGNISTGISMNKASSQFVSVDCGSIEVKEFWGSYLDYAPFTKAELYLPYCGTHPIDIDDIMGKTIHVVYHVDILSGACCAYVQCGESVLYTFVGQCSVSIPITGNDWTNVVNGALTIGASIGTMVATGGASAPMATQTIASTAVNSLKPSVEKSGALSGMGGMLANQTPYLIITLPRQAVPENQNTFMGYPSFVTTTLSECTGYTEVDKIHLENVSATEKEIDEIELLLKSGVII